MNTYFRPALVCLSALLLATPLFAQRDLKNIPDPDPELERASFLVPEGFEVNLFAADPLLAKPIQMNFDAQGRLWVASSEVYPQIKPGQKATDKILVLEDADHNGVAEKTHIFADGLFIPTGVLPDATGGVYVANSTELLHLSDRDGDLKSDASRIVLSGFGTEDTHHLLHTLRWGHDGQLYMNQSIYIHSHVETPHGVRRLNGGGIWRFRPETQQLDVLCYGFVNSWGHHFDRWGQSFATDGAYGEGINYVFPGSVFVSSPGATRIMNGLNPGSPKHCGLEILSGRHLPDDWQGNMLTNDFRAHRVCRFVVTEDASGYASRQETEVIKTQHGAFRPIDVKMGPDGAIYIADWYNPIIQHGEVDFRDERRDHVHGRIWRVTAKGRPALETQLTTQLTIPQLLEKLTVPEEWTRLWAKLLLKERKAEEVVSATRQWVAGLNPQDAQYEHNRLEALWVYQAVRAPQSRYLQELLQSNDHRVRAAAVRVAMQWKLDLDNLPSLLATAVVDEHPRVRLEAVRALAELGTVEGVGLAALALDRPLDKNLDFALWKTFRDTANVWMPALQAGSFNFKGNVDHLTYALRSVESPDVAAHLWRLVVQNKVPADRVDGLLQTIASLGNSKDLEQLIEGPFASRLSDPEKGIAILQALQNSAKLRKVTPAGDPRSWLKIYNSSDVPLAIETLRFFGAWKAQVFKETLLKEARSASAHADVRAAALEALVEYPGEEATTLFRQYARDAGEMPVRLSAIRGLARRQLGAAAAIVALVAARSTDTEELTGTFNAVIAQKGGAEALAKSLREQSVPGDNAKLLIRLARGGSQPLPGLIEALQQAGSLQNAGYVFTPELQAMLVSEMRLQGDATRGELVYRRKEMQCMKCHAIGGAGGVVGPGLESIGASAPDDYLVEALLAPAAKVKEGFHSKMIVTDEGKFVSGIPVRETKTEFVLRDAEDRLITVPKDTIDEIKDGRSLMPDGLANDLTRQELVDLLRFLSEIGEVGGKFAVGKERLVRRWQTLTWSADAHRLLNRNSFDVVAGQDPALQWEVAYSRVNGELPVDGLAPFVPHKGLDPTAFVRFEIDVTSPGAVQLNFNKSQGLTLWVDGKPTKLEEQTSFDLTSGKHQFTVAINQTLRGAAGLKIELVDVANSTARAAIINGK